MVNIDGPFFHSGHNVYRRIKISDEEIISEDSEITEIEAWIGLFCDEASARGAAEALNVRHACDWEYQVPTSQDEEPQRRMSFHSDWEDIAMTDLPITVRESFGESYQ